MKNFVGIFLNFSQRCCSNPGVRSCLLTPLGSGSHCLAFIDVGDGDGVPNKVSSLFCTSSSGQRRVCK